MSTHRISKLNLFKHKTLSLIHASSGFFSGGANPSNFEIKNVQITKYTGFYYLKTRNLPNNRVLVTSGGGGGTLLMLIHNMRHK